MATVKTPNVCSLSAKDHFNALQPEDKLYAHHAARAAWHGARIILRQVSPESRDIFDFIMQLFRSWGGDWAELAAQARVPMSEMRRFLDYAAVFLSNIGNYYGHGDQKFVPDVSAKFLKAISGQLTLAPKFYDDVTKNILSPRPATLGFASEVAQSAYYLGDDPTNKSDLDLISGILNQHAKTAILPENTRIRKKQLGDRIQYDVLIASIEIDPEPLETYSEGNCTVRVIRGDHSESLNPVVECLKQAKCYASTATQEGYILELKESLQTGDLETYRDSLRLWLNDVRPPVETVYGFVEPYRDPHGVRAEFEGLVAVVDSEKTKQLDLLCQSASKFVKRLPWCGFTGDNDGKGAFEKSNFEKVDMTSLHTIAYCSSIIFPGINLPNYNDIRQAVGSKNLMIANSIMQDVPESDTDCIHASEKVTYLKHKSHAFYLWVVFHEMLGHGTGKLLMEEAPGKYNFDPNKPPINPITKQPIQTWYKPGQTWTSLFGDLATTVDECRAECVGAYLMSDMELLSNFGYGKEIDIHGRDLEYNMYQQLGVAGLNALRNYNVETKSWGQAHSRAHLAIFRCLLAAGDNFLEIRHNKEMKKLTVTVDPGKIATHGRPAIERLLLQLHIQRCTAEVEGCRAFYSILTDPDEQLLKWRKTMVANEPPKRIFVQPNTFIRSKDEDEEVVLKEYEATVEGVIQSWAEREI